MLNGSVCQEALKASIINPWLFGIHEKPFIGCRSSLSKEEMLVPFLAARL